MNTVLTFLTYSHSHCWAEVADETIAWNEVEDDADVDVDDDDVDDEDEIAVGDEVADAEPAEDEVADVVFIGFVEVLTTEPCDGNSWRVVVVVAVVVVVVVVQLWLV